MDRRDVLLVVYGRSASRRGRKEHGTMGPGSKQLSWRKEGFPFQIRGIPNLVL